MPERLGPDPMRDLTLTAEAEIRPPPPLVFVVHEGAGVILDPATPCRAVGCGHPYRAHYLANDGAEGGCLVVAVPRDDCPCDGFLAHVHQVVLTPTTPKTAHRPDP